MDEHIPPCAGCGRTPETCHQRHLYFICRCGWQWRHQENGAGPMRWESPLPQLTTINVADPDWSAGNLVSAGPARLDFHLHADNGPYIRLESGDVCLWRDGCFHSVDWDALLRVVSEKAGGQTLTNAQKLGLSLLQGVRDSSLFAMIVDVAVEELGMDVAVEAETRARRKALEDASNFVEKYRGDGRLGWTIADLAARVLRLDDALACLECGEDCFVGDDGVAHHGSDGEIDHDQDADHTAIPEDEP